MVNVSRRDTQQTPFVEIFQHFVLKLIFHSHYSFHFLNSFPFRHRFLFLISAFSVILQPLSIYDSTRESVSPTTTSSQVKKYKNIVIWQNEGASFFLSFISRPFQQHLFALLDLCAFSFPKTLVNVVIQTSPLHPALISAHIYNCVEHNLIIIRHPPTKGQ